jgi:hypothetical protein
MAYTMREGIVRRIDDSDWGRPALASEAWAFEEIERLRAILAGIECALARDGDIDGAMKLIVGLRHPEQKAPK